METVLDDKTIDRYLAILDSERREPSFKALSELISAHATRIPFENISKLYNFRRLKLAGPPAIEHYLEGIERFHFGGTCYANNFHLYTLLNSLGYDVRLCAADMAHPDVHMVSMVVIDGGEYIVDVGYAAPFLSPLPRDLSSDYTITLGNSTYILRPQDVQHRSRLDLYRDGAPLHGYTAKPEPRRFEEFADVIAGSFRPNATFLNAVLLARFYPGRSVVLHNLKVIESRGSESVVRSLPDRRSLAPEIEKLFDIPAAIVEEATQGITELQDPFA